MGEYMELGVIPPQDPDAAGRQGRRLLDLDEEVGVVHLSHHFCYAGRILEVL